MQSTAVTILAYLFLLVVLLGTLAWCGAVYHFLRFERAWRQEGAPGRSYFAFFVSNLPEPRRTHRKRVLQFITAFVALNALAWLLAFARELLHG